MSRWRRPVETLHIVALGVWLGVLLATGAAAAVLFPTMRDLEPTLGAFAAYEGEHWRLAAGVPAARLFAIADVVQFVCAAIVLVTMAIGLMGWLGRGVVSGLRTVAVGGALIAFSYGFFVVGNEMTRELQAYWAAAKAGEMQRANEAQARFTGMHPTASRTMGVTAALVAVGFVAGTWQATAGVTGKTHGEEG